MLDAGLVLKDDLTNLLESKGVSRKHFDYIMREPCAGTRRHELGKVGIDPWMLGASNNAWLALQNENIGLRS